MIVAEVPSDSDSIGAVSIAKLPPNRVELVLAPTDFESLVVGLKLTHLQGNTLF